MQCTSWPALAASLAGRGNGLAGPGQCLGLPPENVRGLSPAAGEA
ncbi:hypothetical protein CSC33_5789 [Pseudomonas aeruginosa]|nr:hypothetical protein CSC33_5789 [Pseudomonas aeruginosa]